MGMRLKQAVTHTTVNCVPLQVGMGPVGWHVEACSTACGHCSLTPRGSWCHPWTASPLPALPSAAHASADAGQPTVSLETRGHEEPGASGTSVWPGASRHEGESATPLSPGP